MHAQAQHDAGTGEAPLPFMRLPMVMRVTGLGRSTIYRMIAGDQFPKPFRIGERAVAWRQADVDRWSEGRSPTP